MPRPKSVVFLRANEEVIARRDLDPAFGAGQPRPRYAMDWCLDFSASVRDRRRAITGPLAVATAAWGRRFRRAAIALTTHRRTTCRSLASRTVSMGASGFSNLLLAGDWVFTGLGGAVESAVIGGMQAAEAATGQSLGIIGALANPWSRLPRYQR